MALGEWLGANPALQSLQIGKATEWTRSGIEVSSSTTGWHLRKEKERKLTPGGVGWKTTPSRGPPSGRVSWVAPVGPAVWNAEEKGARSLLIFGPPGLTFSVDISSTNVRAYLAASIL